MLNFPFKHNILQLVYEAPSWHYITLQSWWILYFVTLLKYVKPNLILSQQLYNLHTLTYGAYLSQQPLNPVQHVLYKTHKVRAA